MRSCLTCKHIGEPLGEDPCYSCFGADNWELQPEQLTQEQRITELERRLDELTETLRNV